VWCECACGLFMVCVVFVCVCGVCVCLMWWYYYILLILSHHAPLHCLILHASFVLFTLYGYILSFSGFNFCL